MTAFILSLFSELAKILNKLVPTRRQGEESKIENEAATKHVEVDNWINDGGKPG